MKVFNFKKATVIIYNNRIEIKHKGLGNFFLKGHAGNIIISLKHLEAIFFTKDSRIEFVTAGMPHSENMLLAVKRENQIQLTGKDAEKAKELISILEELL